MPFYKEKYENELRCEEYPRQEEATDGAVHHKSLQSPLPRGMQVWVCGGHDPHRRREERQWRRWGPFPKGPRRKSSDEEGPEHPRCRKPPMRALLQADARGGRTPGCTGPDLRELVSQRPHNTRAPMERGFFISN